MSANAYQSASHGQETRLASILRDLAPRRVAAWLDDRPRLLAPLRIVTLLVAFVVVDRLCLRVGRLSDASYAEPLLVVELLRSMGWPAAVLAAGALIVLGRFGALLAPWSALDHRAGLRAFVVFVAFVVVWPLATQGHDFYHDQGHLADRALLVGLLVALWFRPVFVLPLALLLATLLFQLAVPPLGGSVLAHKLHVLHVVNLFAAALLLHALTGARWTTEFVFLCCCMVAGSYFTAALAKFDLAWWSWAELHLMPASAYGHGWLDFAGADAVGELTKRLEPLGELMVLAVLAVEGGCLLFLVRRTVSIALLVAVIVFHLGVLALYGFFFWTWILVDVALLALLLARADVLRELRTGAAGLALSMLLIATAVYWSRPPWLAWFDTGLTYTYRVEAIGASGRRYALAADYFAPYSDVFTMSSFAYLSDSHGVLTATYGVTKDPRIAEGIAAARSAESIFELEKIVGRPAYDAKRAERLQHFVARYVANRNARDGRPPSAAALAPPPQFISHRAGVGDTASDPLREIVVREVTTWFDGNRPTEIRELEVARIRVEG